MKNFFALLALSFTNLLFAQVSVISVTPQNNATNVALSTTVTFTFSTAINTNYLELNQHVFTNIDSSDRPTFSQDLKTMTVHVYLKPNTVYFVAFVFLKGMDGSVLTAPEVFYFTTGASFPTLSISGTLHSGNTGVSPEHAIVGISKMSVMESENPSFVLWANVNADGSFTIPYVVDGTYWPVAAKDVDMDGSIDPGKGVDALAFGDSIVVNGASITNLDLTFVTWAPLTFHKALPIADSLAQNLPQDRILKSIRGYRVDTVGRSQEWNFIYTINNNTSAIELNISSMSSRTDLITDQGYLYSLIQAPVLTNPALAAASSTVMEIVEGEGGKTFRQQSAPDSMMFRIDMALGDLSMSDFWMLNPEPNVMYWGVKYSFGVEKPYYWQEYKAKYFLCNFSTGAVVKSGTMGVENEITAPRNFALYQNYPNPFNPSTVISYQVPVNSTVTIKVFDAIGREVATLVNEKQEAGTYHVSFNASGLASGLYFYQLRAGNFVQTKKMMVVK